MKTFEISGVARGRAICSNFEFDLAEAYLNNVLFIVDSFDSTKRFSGIDVYRR